MTPIISIVVLIVATVCLLGAIVFLIRGFTSRQSGFHGAYGVQQQEARKGMLVDYYRGGFFLLLAIILFGIFGLSFIRNGTPEESTPIPAENLATPTMPSITSTPSISPTVFTPVSSPTSPINSPTPVATDTVTPTQTPAVPSAVVNSPNGLWLREAPGGTQQLELIADGTVLILLPERESADDTEWQLVRTPAGNDGWVAVDFLVYQ